MSPLIYNSPSSATSTNSCKPPSCFTDCLAATSLAYESPEADVLLRPPRKIGVDRLVDWKLIVQSYGIVGIFETVASFAMSYWYLERNGTTA